MCLCVPVCVFEIFNIFIGMIKSKTEYVTQSTENVIEIEGESEKRKKK